MKPANVGECLKEFYALSGEIDELNEQLKKKNERWAELEAFIIDESERHGSEKFALPEVVVSVKSDIRAAYDPERWEDYVRWCAETGNFACIQRRLGEKALKEMLDAGCEIPEFIRFEPYRKVSVRRV